MLQTILLDILGPILLMVGLGALLRWRFAIDLGTLSKLSIYLFTPAFIFDRVSRSRLEWSEMAGIVIVTIAMIAVMAAIAWSIGRALRKDRKTVAAIGLAVMFYNSGNFGLPLAELAYPTDTPAVATRTLDAPAAAPARPERNGGAVQTFVVLTQNVLTFTLGLAIAAGADSTGVREIAVKMFRLPVIYTMLAALAARYFYGPETGRQMPTILEATARYLAAGLVPTALVTLGAQLASNPRWPRWRPVGFVFVVRMLAAPALMMGLLWSLHVLMPGSVLDLWPWPAALLILTAGVPTAINTLLLTLELEGDVDLAADCVFWTTIGSVATILFWLAITKTMPSLQ
jgi:predicted permease